MVSFSSRRRWDDDAGPDLTGKYKCAGHDITGAEYKGSVEIQRVEVSYHVKWTLRGGPAFIGVGIQHGKMLSVNWFSPMSTGVMVYELQDDGSLQGRWAILNGKGTIQKETLTPIAPAE